jgi:hypothetical protein
LGNQYKNFPNIGFNKAGWTNRLGKFARLLWRAISERWKNNIKLGRETGALIDTKSSYKKSTPSARISCWISLHGAYATDGYWVILDDNLVKGADATTFRQIFPLELSGSQIESQTYMHFGRDKNFVYYLNEKLENADPDSFGLLSYNECRNPPDGIQFNSNQVQLGAGWVAIDREQAWEVTFTGIIPLTTTEAELHVLQDDFKRAAAASTITSRGDFDESKCRR